MVAGFTPGGLATLTVRNSLWCSHFRVEDGHPGYEGSNASPAVWR